MDPVSVEVWAAWIGGLLIGSYALLQFWVTGKPLGVSTGYGSVCSLVSNSPYFCEGEYKERLSWRVYFLVGLPLGGVLAFATSSGVDLSQWTLHFEMDAYEAVLPSESWLRALVLVGGGVLIGYGARLAGGCTSGHSIAGMGMLNPPSFLASVGYFIGGILAVQFLFRLLL